MANIPGGACSATNFAAPTLIKRFDKLFTTKCVALEVYLQREECEYFHGLKGEGIPSTVYVGIPNISKRALDLDIYIFNIIK